MFLRKFNCFLCTNFYIFLGDFHIINGVLRTAHSLFKKYRYEFKSNELWTEIKLVLHKLAQPLTDLLLVSFVLFYKIDINFLFLFLLL